ncbi:hypothetical protein SALBM135S_08362 [Streptomyces alboniger]
MDETLSWYRAMPPENRSWIGLVAQAGIAAFTEWFRRPDTPRPSPPTSSAPPPAS